MKVLTLFLFLTFQISAQGTRTTIYSAKSLALDCEKSLILMNQ